MRRLLNFCLRNFGAASGSIFWAWLCLKLGADIHDQEDQAVRWACMYGQTKAAKYLIEHGADFTSGNDAPICYALIGKHVETARMLYQLGADIPAYMEPRVLECHLVLTHDDHREAAKSKLRLYE